MSHPWSNTLQNSGKEDPEGGKKISPRIFLFSSFSIPSGAGFPVALIGKPNAFRKSRNGGGVGWSHKFAAVAKKKTPFFYWFFLLLFLLFVAAYHQGRSKRYQNSRSYEFIGSLTCDVPAGVNTRDGSVANLLNPSSDI